MSTVNNLISQNQQAQKNHQKKMQKSFAIVFVLLLSVLIATVAVSARTPIRLDFDKLFTRLLADNEEEIFEDSLFEEENDLSVSQLKQIMPGLSDSKAQQYLGPLNNAMRSANINTPQRQAAFLAQLGHESGNLKWFKEFASGKAYEGRKDLGNTHPGDGVRYKGRGPIQITGRSNYEKAGKAIGVDLVNNPQLAERPDVGFKVAAWYWNSRGLNKYADQNNQQGFDVITKRINGGYNGKADRDAHYRVAKNVLGGKNTNTAPAPTTPVKPTTKPTTPVKPVTKPTTKPVRPVTKPVTKPVKPTTRPVRPVRPTKPVRQPVKRQPVRRTTPVKRPAPVRRQPVRQPVRRTTPVRRAPTPTRRPAPVRRQPVRSNPVRRQPVRTAPVRRAPTPVRRPAPVRRQPVRQPVRRSAPVRSAPIRRSAPVRQSRPVSRSPSRSSFRFRRDAAEELSDLLYSFM